MSDAQATDVQAQKDAAKAAAAAAKAEKDAQVKAQKEAAKAAAAEAKAAAKAEKDAEKAKIAEAKKAAAEQRAAEKAAKASEKQTKVKVAQSSQNGVTRPKPDSKTGHVWAIADALSAAKGSPVAISELLPEAKKAGLNEATTKTQYARWKDFHGIYGQVPKAVAAAPVASEPAPEPVAA